MTLVSATSSYTYNATNPANSIANGVITFKARANGGDLSPTTANDVTVQVCGSNGCASTGVSKSVTTSPSQSVILDGSEEIVTVSAAYTGGSGYIYFKISEIDWTMRAVTIRQTSGLENFKTPSVYTYGGAVTSINGACGTAARAYTYTGSSTLINSNLCAAGTALPSSVTLPAANGSVATWKCMGSNGGVDAICSASVLSSLIQPSITVTSPNGGGIYRQGDAMNITWNSVNIPSTANNLLTLTLRSAPSLTTGTSNYPITPNGCTSILSQGSYSWTIPASIPNGQYIVSANVCLPDPQGLWTIYDDSNNYSIITAPTAGSNVSRDNLLASISDALAKIMAQIQAMLSK